LLSPNDAGTLADIDRLTWETEAEERLATTTTSAGTLEAAGANLSLGVLICIDALHMPSDSSWDT
jgi:hypothetical protein